jgi:Tfp pilus assembly protein PilN
VRPINLIPEQEQRRSRGPSSSGNPLAYLIVGALAIALAGVVMLVLTSNTINDRESEVATLQVEKAAATARAERLSAYASFQQVAEQRKQTIAGLADGRFDWARVIKQLSLVLPPDVFFTNLSGSAGSGESSEGIAVPSLTIAGCAPTQNAVAGFVATLKQIDGVTRVELKQSGVSANEGQVNGASVCSVGNKAQFSILVAFDEAPASPDSATATEAPTTEAPTTEGEGSETEGSTSTGTESPEGAPTESTSATTADPTGAEG